MCLAAHGNSGDYYFMPNSKETSKKLIEENRDHLSVYNKTYRERNKAAIAERMKSYNKKYATEKSDFIKQLNKKYYERNKEILRAKSAQNWRINKEIIKEKNKLRYQKNRDRVLQRAKEYRVKNREKRKKYLKENKEQRSETVKKWRQKNNGIISEKTKRRKRVDLLFRLRSNCGSATARAFSRIRHNKPCNSENLIGLKWCELKVYIERQFTKGMNWSNYGRGMGKWNIDHKIPLASAKTEEELMKLCHYTNLQPLWHYENQSKSDKIIPTQMSLIL